jgi:hypothetical protein
MIIRTYPALPSLWRPVSTVLWNGNAGEVEMIKQKGRGRPRAEAAGARWDAVGWRQAGGMRWAGGRPVGCGGWQELGRMRGLAAGWWDAGGWRQAGGMRGAGGGRTAARCGGRRRRWRGPAGSGRWGYGGLAGAAQQRNRARRIGLGSKDRVQAKVAIRLQPPRRGPALPLCGTGHGRTGGGRESGWPGPPTQLGRIRCRLGCPTRR